MYAPGLNAVDSLVYQNWGFPTIYNATQYPASNEKVLLCSPLLIIPCTAGLHTYYRGDRNMMSIKYLLIF